MNNKYLNEQLKQLKTDKRAHKTVNSGRIVNTLKTLDGKEVLEYTQEFFFF